MLDSSLAGKIIGGRYQVQTLIGQGGMAAVYKAYDPNLHRSVAVKIFHPHLAANPDFIRRFEAEATLVAGLRHPHIPVIFDFNHDGDTVYIVMEYIDGETLESRLRNLHDLGRQLPLADAVCFTVDLCDALAYAHQHDVIHRDIKPANAMLDRADQIFLMDFGVAKIVGGQSHTSTGALIGTAYYMAPEQIQGLLIDPRVDIYALGVTLFEMLAGRRPFEADSAMTLMMMHLNDPVPDVHQLRPDVPAPVAAVIAKAMAKNRIERYPSAVDLALALRQSIAPPSDPRGVPLTPLASAALPDSTFIESATPHPTSVPSTYEPASAREQPIPNRDPRAVAPIPVVPLAASTGYNPQSPPSPREQPIANRESQTANREQRPSSFPASPAESAYPVRPERSKTWLYLLAALALVAIAIAAFLFWSKRQTPTNPAQPAQAGLATSLPRFQSPQPAASEQLTANSEQQTATDQPPIATSDQPTTLPTGIPTSQPANSEQPTANSQPPTAAIELPTATSESPTATSESRTSPTSGFTGNCIDAKIWNPYKTQGVTQDANGCWDLSHWGMSAENSLLVMRLFQSPKESERSIYRKLTPAAVLKLKVNVSELITSPDLLGGLAFGVGRPENWQQAGRYIIFRRPPDSPSIQVYLSSGVKTAGEYVAAANLHDELDLEIHFANGTVAFYLNGVEIGSPSALPANLAAQPVFSIGFDLPTGASLTANTTLAVESP